MKLPNPFKRKSYPKVPYQTTTRELIQKEAKVGAELFGFLGPNRRREFFMLDKHTWVWYEEWRDAKGIHRVTTRYEVHKGYVLKVQNDGVAVAIDDAELQNLYDAVRSYYYAVADKVYHRPVAA